MRSVQRTGKIIKGSIHDVAESMAGGLPQAMSEAEVVVVVDVSGSMTSYDGEPKARWQRAQDVLTDLQGQYSGKIVLVPFSTDVEFSFSGMLPPCNGGTNMDKALRFVRDLSSAYQIVLVTDGEPNSREATIAEAKKLHSPLTVMYVGAENDMRAREFLNELAQVSGGTFTVTKPELIGGGIKGLLV